ncbi:MAG: co-chaperone GroES [Deltaproteobacteria bacterium]|nr:co-chaperone GroES [Deltaproteobacteria bacterium]
MENLPIQPLQDYVLVEPVEAEDVTPGGIIVPDTAKEKPAEGMVVGKAADSTDDVIIGDRVVYQKFSGHEIKIQGRTMRLVPSGDLLAKYVQTDAIPE